MKSIRDGVYPFEDWCVRIERAISRLLCDLSDQDALAAIRDVLHAWDLRRPWHEALMPPQHDLLSTVDAYFDQLGGELSCAHLRSQYGDGIRASIAELQSVFTGQTSLLTHDVFGPGADALWVEGWERPVWYASLLKVADEVRSSGALGVDRARALQTAVSASDPCTVGGHLAGRIAREVIAIERNDHRFGFNAFNPWSIDDWTHRVDDRYACQLWTPDCVKWDLVDCLIRQLSGDAELNVDHCIQGWRCIMTSIW